MDGTKKLGTTDVGFIGLGKMGIPMVMNLLGSQGQDGAIGTVTVTGRSVERAESVITAGAKWVSTPRDVADACSVLVLMVPDLPEVEELLFGEAGIALSHRELVVVICSTVSGTKLRDSAVRPVRQRSAA